MEENLKQNIHISLNHFAVYLKHCKPTILQKNWGKMHIKSYKEKNLAVVWRMDCRGQEWKQRDQSGGLCSHPKRGQRRW